MCMMGNYDVLIAGGGPAGLCAAIYCGRAGLNTAVAEKLVAGGQMATTPDISNYPGFEVINGMDLAMKMQKHAENEGTQWIYGEITAFDFTPGALSVTVDGEKHSAKTLILSMGTTRRKLDVPGEKELSGLGVSYCATCDGNFFKGREVAVVGGGDTALEDAIYLANICAKVYLVHRRNQFRGGKKLENTLRKLRNVELVLDSVPVSVDGQSSVDGLTVKNKETQEERKLAVAGVFVAVGTVPNSQMLAGKIKLDEQGRVQAGEDCLTDVPGVYVVGDLRTKPLYQIVTALADGAVASAKAQQFLSGSDEPPAAILK